MLSLEKKLCRKQKNQKLITKIGLDGCCDSLVEIVEQVHAYKKNPSRILVIGEAGSGKNIVAGILENYLGEVIGRINGRFNFADPLGFIKTYHGDSEFGYFPKIKGTLPDKKYEIKESKVAIREYHRLNPVNQTILGNCFDADVEAPQKIKMVATANVSFYKKFLAGKVFPNSFLGFDQVIHLPSLTRRFEDLEILVPIIVKEVKSNYSQANRDICLDEIDGFHFYNWPGNVAELKQVIFELLTKDTPRWVGKYEIKEFLEERRMNGSGDFYMKQNLGEYRE